jgi:hypothetical protein
MRTLRQEVAGKFVGVRRQCWLSAVLLCGAMALCVGCQSAFVKVEKEKEKPPTGTVSQILPMWQKQVAWSPNPLNNGAPVAALTGRIYLMAADSSGTTLEGDGTLEVVAYDCADPAHPAAIEGWRFDQETLKRLLSKDGLGWGYSLIMPWGTYRPDFNRIRLSVSYRHDEKTTPVTHPGDLMAMEPSVSMFASNTTGPTGLRQPALAPFQANGISQTGGSIPPAGNPDGTTSSRMARIQLPQSRQTATVITPQAQPQPAYIQQAPPTFTPQPQPTFAPQPQPALAPQPMPNQLQPTSSIGTIAPVPPIAYQAPAQSGVMYAPGPVAENPPSATLQPVPQPPALDAPMPATPVADGAATSADSAPGMVQMPDGSNVVQFAPTAPAGSPGVRRFTLPGGIQRPATMP